MKGTVAVQTMGRLGNQMFQYAHAKAYAEKYGYRLECAHGLLHTLFELDDPPISKARLYVNELVPLNGEHDLEFRGYYQTQGSLLYTRADAKRWFVFRPHIRELLETVATHELVAHRRVGDYHGYGYCVVDRESYVEACRQFGANCERLCWVTEEEPHAPDLFKQHPYLPDFWIMMQARVLLRGNSSFSWWAAVLGCAEHVYAPIIENKTGDSRCQFVRGNHPRFASLGFLTDLQLEDMKEFTENARYEYNLTPDSLCVDAGFHQGRWTLEMHRRYGCTVFAFEPVQSFYESGQMMVKNIPRIVLTRAGLGGFSRVGHITERGDSSTFLHDNPEVTQDAPVLAIDGVLRDLARPVDVLKLNIEGMEFELLERLLDSGMAKQCRNIQVQFHPVVPDAEIRRQRIRADLLRTHHLTFDCPWVWENYEL